MSILQNDIEQNQIDLAEQRFTFLGERFRAGLVAALGIMASASAQEISLETRSSETRSFHTRVAEKISAIQIGLRLKNDAKLGADLGSEARSILEKTLDYVLKERAEKELLKKDLWDNLDRSSSSGNLFHVTRAKSSISGLQIFVSVSKENQLPAASPAEAYVMSWNAAGLNTKIPNGYFYDSTASYYVLSSYQYGFVPTLQRITPDGLVAAAAKLQQDRATQPSKIPGLIEDPYHLDEDLSKAIGEIMQLQGTASAKSNSLSGIISGPNSVSSLEADMKRLISELQKRETEVASSETKAEDYAQSEEQRRARNDKAPLESDVSEFRGHRDRSKNDSTKAVDWKDTLPGDRPSRGGGDSSKDKPNVGEKSGGMNLGPFT